MANNKFPINILMDTNALFPAGELFDHPDFRKLLYYSKTGKIKIYISKISWEERRTQLLKNVKDDSTLLRSTIRKLNTQHSNKIVLKDLPEPKLVLWTDEQLEENSSAAIESFAKENNITILPYTKEHTDRAWERYFSVKLPFNREEIERELRRKDIPDAFILEAAVDLIAEKGEVIAIGKDGRLIKALEEAGCKIFKKFQDVIDLVEETQEEDNENDSSVYPATAEGTQGTGNIIKLLAEHKSEINDIEIKVLGFITYLGEVTEEQLYELLERVGVEKDIIDVVARGLVLAGLVKEVGEYYLSLPSDIAQLAENSVEEEIISLIGKS